jgi:DNA methylase
MRALQRQLAARSDDPGERFIDDLFAYRAFGRRTETIVDGGIPYFVNEYWTARQRQSHALHEVSYRACFKAELPRFFIERLTQPGELVYDPFMGRGTTLLEAALLGRRAAGNDVNPLSRLLIRPRLALPQPSDVESRSRDIDWRAVVPEPARELTVFFHPETLAEIVALRRWFVEREAAGRIDAADDWIRMVAINRLTGHSAGFLSVYTLPPNQAVGIAAQRKINADRNQTPPRRHVGATILKKSKRLLRDGGPEAGLSEALLTGDAARTPALRAASVALIVTSPPFLDVVDYKGDNWLRCWFAGIDADQVAIDHHKTVAEWTGFVRRCFEEFVRVVRPGGHIAFEVGEVRGGKVLLEHNVVAATQGLPLTLLGVMVNDQAFTKTSNCWGVSNNRRGTNTNRIVVLRRH